MAGSIRFSPFYKDSLLYVCGSFLDKVGDEGLL